MENNPNFDLIDNPKPVKRRGLFTGKTMNEWMDEAKKEPIPKRLCGVFWYEGEVCLLLGTEGAGKSIFAMQIATVISSGEGTEGAFLCEADPQKVIVFDFELNKKQQENRFSQQYENHYEFSDNLVRFEMDGADTVPDDVDFEQYLREEMANEVEELGARVVIVDNITWISGDTETAKSASPLMKWIHSWARERHLSVLVLCHTPKIKPHPLTSNDVAGSKRLTDFCDSLFAIGKSVKGENMRYIKQLKGRMDVKLYGTNNVIECRMVKPSNRVYFEVEGYTEEKDHLVAFSDDAVDDKAAQAREMSNAGMSQREIARVLGVSVGTVNNYLNK